MNHITGQILGQSVNIDTLYFAWACMLASLLVVTFLAFNLSNETNKFNTRQFLAESIFDFLRGVAKNQIGSRSDKFLFFLGSIFFFILFAYYAGLAPWKLGSAFSWWPMIPGEHGHSHPWHGASPCADINVTAGMAILVITTYVASGIFVGGFSYFQIFLPINFDHGKIKLNFIFFIEILDLIVRPLTLSLRLFANTFAGEILLSTFVVLCPLFIPSLALGFEAFVGVLQAFVFTMLAAVYIGAAIQHAEHAAHASH
ncbi:MAG: F0F1 ATP synthase subunit A [Candidatus Caenarcaniphilales bacterium]|jgi:F-type H+-transporting ATPase subunit a|nr:F0F1 ATP synthase subunit A [Candidatus Caenarcaniphilales bacterium]